jgi:FkbM family methyltransferase
MYLYDVESLRVRFAWLRQTKWYCQNPWRATAKFIGWLVRDSIDKERLFQTSDGVLLVSMPANFSAMAMYLLSDRDPEIQSVIRRTVPSGGIFVDVGANTGTYTVRASQVVGREGRVVAIEAHPFTFGFLQRTIAMNGFTNIAALNIAVGDTRQNVCMKYARLNPGETHVSPDGHTEVMMLPLDDCMAELDVAAIDYLKIDVEGYELFVLRGARRIIEASRGIIVQTEQNESHARRYGHSVMDVVRLLSSYGLRPHLVDKQGIIHAVPESKQHLNGDYLWAFRALS